jgi:uncharacterized protein (TIGR02646 family)
MIRIRKPKRAPAVLRGKGASATAQLCGLYDASPTEYQDGKPFDWEKEKALYGHATVKRALRRAQHDKCCFCESKVTHIASGDVEHFRPKAGYRQRPRDPLTRPGYYWLTHAWENLFFCCELCNRRHKQNLFPLVNPAQRATSHHASVADEQPLFLDPGVDDPTQFITFRQHVACPINGNRRARTTIRALQLNRKELKEKRYEHLRLVTKLKQYCRELAASVNRGEREGLKSLARRRRQLKEAEALLARFTQDDGEYVAMIRALLG